jgi:hypothetical protein
MLTLGCVSSKGSPIIAPPKKVKAHMKGQKFDSASLGIPSLETDALVISDVADHPALSPSRRSSSEKSVDRMELSCEEDDSRKA